MKKVTKILGIFISAILLFTGCTPNDTAESTDENKLQVYTSFYAVYDFVSKIGGDKIQVYNLVPSGTEPHDWEPTSGDMLKLEKGDILFYNGGGMEGWLDSIQSSIENKNLEYVELSNGIHLIEGHHSHDDEEEHHDEHKEASSTDPHIWLNPQNVELEIETIKNKLSEKDPDNKDYYENNYQTVKQQLQKLDGDYKEAISQCSSKDIIVAHEAYGYLCQAYSLNQIAIEGLSAEYEPSPSKMAQISKFAKEHNVKYIFFEELLSQKVAETIATEAGAELLVLSPFEGLTDEQIENGADYFSVMYQNLENLKKALS